MMEMRVKMDWMGFKQINERNMKVTVITRVKVCERESEAVREAHRIEIHTHLGTLHCSWTSLVVVVAVVVAIFIAGIL